MSDNTPKRHHAALQFAAAWLLLIAGIGLLVGGFIVPPPGEIHSSVLVAYGETLTFVGAVFGIDYHYRYYYRPNHNDNDNDNENDR